MDKTQRMIIIRLGISIAFIVSDLAIGLPERISILLYVAAYIVIGADIVFKALHNIAHGKVFDENFLMTVATIGAFAIGEYPEAVAVMALYQLGELLSDMAVERSRSSITALMDIRPEFANVEQADGSVHKTLPTDVAVDSIVIVSPGEKIPIDGIVLSGASDIDTSALTGESQPQSAAPGDKVLGGCLNISGALKIRTTAAYADTTVAKILYMVENAETGKARAEKFITRFARYYTPIVVGGAALVAVIPPLTGIGAWNLWLERALIFLVISCPCALVVSVPLTFFAGIGGASRRGILFKGSNYMETLAHARSVVFDKTGTLTCGRFTVTAIHPEIVSETQLLELAALAESFSSHPVAISLRAAYKGSLDQSLVTALHDYPGEGISATLDSRHVYVGNERLMARAGVTPRKCRCVGTIVHLAVDGDYVGHIVVSDTVKHQSHFTIETLARLGIKTIMLTGDKRPVAEEVAQELGIHEYACEMMPDDKVLRVQLLTKVRDSSPVVFVGDGINDAPVLKIADAGIAMGAAGSDAAIAAADIVLMNDDPSQVVTGIFIARKTMRIVRQNIIFALTIKMGLLVVSTIGFANMWAAVFADVGVTLLAVLNSFRAMHNRDIKQF